MAGFPGISSPAIGSDGTIYVGSYDYNLYALTDGGQGTVTEKWAFPTGSYVFSTPAIGPDGTIYIGSYENGSPYVGTLYAVNPDGTEKWAFANGGGFSSPAIGADGTIYTGAYAVNADGTQKWEFANGAGESSPAIGADGTVYIVGDQLYALGGAPSPTPTPTTSVTMPANLSFGKVPLGGTVTKDLSVKDKGSATLSITNVSSSDPEFVPAATTCSAAPRSRCSIAVGFTPNTRGKRTATLTLTDNAGTGTQNVKLKGVGR